MLNIPLLCKEFLVMRHNLENSNKGAFVQIPQFSDFFSNWFLPQDNKILPGILLPKLF